MKNFFKKIGLTFYSSKFYGEARDRSVGHGLKFVFKVLLLLSVILGIIFCLLYVSFSPRMEKYVLNYVQDSYPEDLIVTIKDKILYTNTNEPVFFPMIGEIRQEKNNIKQNILVLAPNEVSADIELLSKYDTYMVITSKSILAQNGESKFETHLLDYEDTNITKSSIIEISVKLFKMFVPIILIFSIPSFLFILGFVTIMHLLTLLIVSLLLYGIFKMQNINMTYKQIYRMGVYSIVPVLLINLVIFPFNLGSSMLDIFIMLSVILYVNKDRKEENISGQVDQMPESIPQENNSDLK